MSAVEHSTLDITLSRVSRSFVPGDVAKGHVVVSCRHGWAHKGIQMVVVGSAALQASARGVFDGGGQARPKELLRESLCVCPAGKFPDGVHEVPFEFAVRAPRGGELRESYHGVYVNVTYTMAVECRRGGMKSTLERELEFIVEVPAKKAPPPAPKPFTITPESLENVRAASVAAIPRFRVTGALHSTVCRLDRPFRGSVVVEEAASAVRSIELQLVRAEAVRHADAGTMARELTEIQNVQIADGDVARNLAIPVYMVFPRLFTCPTVVTEDFKVEFEVNLIVIFGDGYMITENFPITLVRGPN